MKVNLDWHVIKIMLKSQEDNIFAYKLHNER